jgi:DNA-binding NarL/FixJ family response regulator
MSTHYADKNFGSNRGNGAALAPDPAPALTPTQLKVLEGVHSGLLNKQIAYELGIAESTVKAHMTALMRKLNVRNRTQVAIVARAFEQSRTAA